MFHHINKNLDMHQDAFTVKWEIFSVYGDSLTTFKMKVLWTNGGTKT